ncbi:flagellar assembly protein FliW [Paenibacillus sp. N4]|uniref:flagellar assembly protein FliW n=1 Tax=Paenibacillus vietnamensis TaxID=2590547 RepID=UPI001CD08CAB|nr:flagellar assembly protein FliW [Paenibacillus vietnamensis]MCA0757554.1 flagellar assembly protein FliW [Paenibacillus vietnamensis]
MNNESQVFYFENGIPGFEHLHQFELLDLDGEIPLKIMKSKEDDITLFLANPFFIYPDYEWDLSDSAKQELSIQSEADIEVWSVITVPTDPELATINLMAPLVFNVRERLGKQIILHDENYSSRAPLIPA